LPIDAAFESGNIIVQNDEVEDVSLTIRADTNSTASQWFYFKDQPLTGRPRTYRITNAGKTSYPIAWVGYDVLASYDQRTWFRIPSTYDGTNLIWTLTPEQGTIWFAYFVPYLSERRNTVIGELVGKPDVRHRVLGTSVENRPIDLLVFGDETRTEAKKIWSIARQHPGESMTEFAVEGLMRRLGEGDSVVQQVLARATVYVTPNVNPDGSAAGNLRVNAAGVDLNRAWQFRNDLAPEVNCVLDTMHAVGVDSFIDFHGDEDMPFVWLISPEKSRHGDLHRNFEHFLMGSFPEIQPPPADAVVGVPKAPGVAINAVGQRFDCPAWVIEFPFRVTPQGDHFLADGLLKFGNICVDALLHILKGDV